MKIDDRLKQLEELPQNEALKNPSIRISIRNLLENEIS